MRQRSLWQSCHFQESILSMKSLPLKHTKHPITTQKEWAASDPAIKTALEGDPVGPPPRFRLDLGPDFLQFTVGCQRAPWNERAQAKPKTFLAELWKQDVGELFIKAVDSDRYLEINLSPWGAWWACVFSEYRKQDESAPLPKPPNVIWSVAAEAWQSTIILPLDYLEKNVAFGKSTTANVCFILGPAHARRHFSWATLPVGPPNFHRVADFVPLAALVVLPCLVSFGRSIHKLDDASNSSRLGAE